MGLELRAKSKYNFERDEKFEKGFVQIKFDVKKQIEHAESLETSLVKEMSLN